MLYLNLGHNWNLVSYVDNLRGVVVLPSGNSSAKLRGSRLPAVEQLLFDPQLYLSPLDPSECGTVCGRLVSYSWFQAVGDAPPAFDRAQMTRTEWERGLKANAGRHWRSTLPVEHSEIRHLCAEAISLQQEIGCSQIILPAPLIVDREDEAGTEAAWLDAGLEEVESLGIEQPVLATVALDHGVINRAAFRENGFLDTVVDQISARPGIQGVYIVVSQGRARHPFETEEPILAAYLHLCRAFGKVAYDVVLPNFVDIFGLSCMAVGATGFGTGTSQSRRRLSLSDFGDGGGGGLNLPHFYSHRAVAELLTEADLQKFVEKRLLARISDRTPHSQALMARLREGGSAGDMPNWAESHMNRSHADRHFLHRLSLEAANLSRLDQTMRQERAREWMETAAANALLIRKRLGAPIEGRIAPTEMWLDLFDSQT